MRGTFANIRLRNELAPGTEGGWTACRRAPKPVSIYDASMEYQKNGVPLVIIAGKEYGTGSSRDWAAKGTLLLGVRAVIAESFERIHRSNLVGMGVLTAGVHRRRDAPDARPHRIRDVRHRRDVGDMKPKCKLTVRATAADGTVKSSARSRESIRRKR